MKCPECQADNIDSRKFCRECGAKLLPICAACGEQNLPGDKFCGECGADLRQPAALPPIDYANPRSYTPKDLLDKIFANRKAIEGERKQVTVLFADLANFTPLGEKLDPEDVHRVMDGCFRMMLEEIHLKEGTVNQFTGDGIMALFGAPIAHEDHAQRACWAALGIQEALSGYRDKVTVRFGIEFKMRIGLNSGPVVVGAIGDDLRADYTAMGDTVNLASRMESMAEPGTILATEATFRLARQYFEFKKLGLRPVKGKKKRQNIYALLRARNVVSRFDAAAKGGLTQFVGRRSIIEKLHGIFKQAVDAAGQVVAISGEAGVGKSRLIREMKDRVPAGIFAYIEGRCLNYGEAMAYLPVIDLVKGCLGISTDVSHPDIKRRIKSFLPDWEPLLNTHGAALRELLLQTSGDEAFDRLDAKEKRAKTFEAVSAILIERSRKEPLVVVIEDMHWIDATSRAWITDFLDRLAGERIMLILSHRSGYGKTALPFQSTHHHINLDPLPPGARIDMLTALFPEDSVPRELSDLVLRQAGGNPLFIEEIFRSFMEQGFFEKPLESEAPDEAATHIQIPDTIHGIIAGRLDRIKGHLKQVLQVASVMGREFSLGVLEQVMGIETGLEAMLDELAHLEYIVPRMETTEAAYIFQHALIQEVIYSSMLKHNRRIIHEQIGDAISKTCPGGREGCIDLLAYHYLRSENREKAIEYLDLANRKAIAASAAEEAENWFEEAMKILDAQPGSAENDHRRVALAVRQWPVYAMLLKMGDYHTLLTRLEQTASGLDDADLKASFYVQAGYYQLWFGNYGKSIRTLNTASHAAEASRRHDILAQAYMWFMWNYYWWSRYEEALAFTDRVEKVSEASFDSRTFVWSMGAASFSAAHLGRWHQAERIAQQAMSAAEKADNASLVSLAARCQAIAALTHGNETRAITCGRMAIDRAPTPAEKAWAGTTLVVVLCATGGAEEAIDLLEKLAPQFQKAGLVPFKVATTTYTGVAQALAGNTEDALASSRTAMEQAEHFGMTLYTGIIHQTMAGLTTSQNDHQARTHLHHAVSAFRKIDALEHLAAALWDLGFFERDQGRIREAKDYFKEALILYRKIEHLTGPDRVRSELDRLSNK